MRYAIIADGRVENVVVWDGESEWAPPEGATLVATDEAAIGDLYDGETFTRPAPPPPPPPPADVNGFLLAAMSAFDADPIASAIRGNAVLAAWPAFVRALDARNFSAARQFLGLAYQAGTVTQDEYATLLGLLAEYHIPEA